MLQRSTWFTAPGLEGDELHLRRLGDNARGPAVLMLHGAIENGRIFYSPAGRGLGPFLARRGFDVFVGDLRGRGLSRPPIGRGSRYGQTESIVHELPALMATTQQLSGQQQVHLVAHSWGGVLLYSWMARHPHQARDVRSVVCFGSKRTVRIHNRQRLLLIDGFWLGVARPLARMAGFLPARELRIGPDNETVRSHAQSVAWVRPSPWVDPDDGFDYGTAIAQLRQPPALFVAGAGDKCLGHPDDVRRFMAEAGVAHADYLLLARSTGHAKDYGHVDMLTAAEAEQGHFREVERWISRW